MDTECPHRKTVWIGWTDGGYVAAWKCLSCDKVLHPPKEKENDNA